MTGDAKYQNLLSEDFIHACRDYYYLMNRHFPERGVLKLVGDRYRLNGDQRTVLYRGISSDIRSAFRKARLVSDIADNNLVIDGYNVLFTLLNYRLGKITFISTDQILRDAGALHGRLRDEKAFVVCVDIMLDYLEKQRPVKLDIYLDSPVSHSEKHAQLIRNKMQLHHLTGDCYVIKSADWALKQNQHGLIATSDTAIIEKAWVPVIDIPRVVLEDAYRARFLNLSELLTPDETQNAINEC